MSKLLSHEGLIATEVVSTKEATIAVLYLQVDGVDYTFTGTAKLDPSDKFDESVGVELALARALDSAAKRFSRRANGFIKCADDNKQASEAAKLRNAKREANKKERKKAYKELNAASKTQLEATSVSR